MNKILVSDFDGTLYTTFDEFLYNLQEIKKFINRNNIFIIATGRNYKDIIKLTEHYNIPFQYIICNDGGTIFDKNGKLIYKRDIPVELSHNILKYIYDNDLYDLTYIDTGFDYTKDINNNVNGIIIKVVDIKKSEKILDKLLKKFDDINGYISDNWINITQKDVSKANAIKFIMEKDKIKKENIYTIGNTINDISMIKEFSGSCIKTATNDLKSVCSFCINSVGEYIRYIENQEGMED